MISRTGESRDICVSYGQRHENRWYCAVTEPGAPSPAVFTRRACGICPPLTSGARQNGRMPRGGKHKDVRYREIRCCIPRAGVECTKDEITNSYRCSSSDRPAKFCADYNRAAGSDRSENPGWAEEERGRANFLDNILYSIVIAFVVALFFMDTIYRCVADACRTFCRSSNYRNPRDNGPVAAGARVPPVAGGRVEAEEHLLSSPTERYPKQRSQHRTPFSPRGAEPSHLVSDELFEVPDFDQY